jgi:hypothetical protein
MKQNQKHNSMKIGIIALTGCMGAVLPVCAEVIDFESQPAGPSLYSSASPIPQTVITDGTTFTGGVILTATENLPADQTTLYGTTGFVSGMSNPLVISNPNGFDNFFFSLVNGNRDPQSYRISDNAGHSAEFDNVPDNLDSGAVVVGFASTGTQVTITDITDPNDWDFFIDNVNFNTPLPAGLVPDVASTAWLMGGAVLGMAALARHLRATA